MTMTLRLRGNVEITGLHSFILGSMLAIIGTQMIATGSYMKVYGIIHNKVVIARAIGSHPPAAPTF